MSISLFFKKLIQVESSIVHKFCSQKSVDLSDPAVHRYLGSLMVEHESLLWSGDATSKKRIRELQPVVRVLQKSIRLHDNIEALRRDLKKTNQDKELNRMVREKAATYVKRFNKIDSELQDVLLEPFLTDGSVLVEVTANSEAQVGVLFAKDLFDLYKSYAKYKDWEIDIALLNKSYFGGFRKAAMLIEGFGVPELMSVEAGVHRVRKIPEYEKDGRIHASTVSVSVLPQPTEEELSIPDHDLTVVTNFANDKQVRITHIPTKTEVECREGESKLRSLEIALQRLRVVLFQKQNEQNSKTNTGRLTRSYFGTRRKIIRTYNYVEDSITEHREGCGLYNLKCFMQNVKQLEEMQTILLRQQKYQALMSALNEFSKKNMVGGICCE